jgi:Flp pilus assembly protein TadG
MKPAHLRFADVVVRFLSHPARPAKRGQALVEMAIILPLLLVILTGILQFGVLLSGQIGLVNGVRDAARYGSVLQTATSSAATTNGAQVDAYLTSTAAPVGILPGRMPGYQPSRLVAHAVTYCAYQNPGSSPATYSVRITVSATYNHPLFVPIIAQLIDGIDGSFDDGFTLHASEQFRVENIPLSAAEVSTLATC